MSPTSTEGLPPVIACASGVCICTMSHCRPDSESLSVAGAFGRSPGGGPPAACPSSSLIANRAVAAALSTALLDLGRLLANDGLVELAITTPIWSYEATIVPPARWIDLAAFAGTLSLLKRTMYFWALPAAAPAAPPTVKTAIAPAATARAQSLPLIFTPPPC